MFLKCLSFQFLLFLCSLGLRLTLRPIPSPTLPLLSFWGLPSLAPRVSLGGGPWQPWACVTSTRQGTPHLSPGVVRCRGQGRRPPRRHAGWGHLRGGHLGPRISWMRRRRGRVLLWSHSAHPAVSPGRDLRTSSVWPQEGAGGSQRG